MSYRGDATPSANAFLTERVKADQSFARLFEASPAPLLVLAPDTPHFTITEVNDAYLSATMTKRENIVGRGVFEAFPDNPSDPTVEGVSTLRASLELILATRKPDTLPGLKYDIARPDGTFEERWWSPVNSPVLNENGKVEAIIHNANDVTAQYRAEAALRESVEQQKFMLELSDALRLLDTPLDIAAEAAARLGKWLGLNRVFYGEIVGTEMTVECDYTDGVASLVGTHDMTAFGDFLLNYRADALIVSEDTQVDTRYGKEARAGLLERQVASFCDIELFETGDCVSLMCAQSATTRQWTAMEQGAVREVGSRVKLAVERARAEAALHASEARFRLMADAVPSMVWVIDGDGRNEFFNKQWFDYTGAGSEPTSAAEVSDEFLHPEDATATMTAFNEARRTGTTYVVEHRIRSKSGDYRWFLVRGEPYRDPSTGKIVRWFGASVDIHDRKLAEARLSELNATLEKRVAERTAERNMLATLVETTDVMIMAIDLDYNILATNAANAHEFERIYGVRPNAGDNMLELLAHQPEHQEQVRSGWARGLRGEEVTFVEDFGDPDRDRPFYEVKFQPLRNGAGQQIGAYQFVTDVTGRLRNQAQLAEAQEALRQSQKMEAMGQLTGGVAHDFNNLLTPIVGSLDMLQRKGLGGEREQRLIAGAIQSADRAKTLVQRLLAFARRQPLQASAVDVSTLVTNMADLVASTTGPQIKVVVEVADDLPPAKADFNQLEMALLNLGVNARDAMPDGGTLRITASCEVVGVEHRAKLSPGEYVCLSVADTGVGMDEATLTRAVEPFFSTKGVGKGTGLGLSMVHGLASQLGGGLTIKSRQGVGTNVDFWLPISKTPVELAKAPAAAVSTLAAKGTALLVDDEELVRMSTADMLTDLGYSVVEAGSAEEALRLVDGGLGLDLMITDHLMPGMNGTDLAQILRSNRPEIQVLIISGYAEIDGIDPNLPRLTKPFTNADLAAKLSKLGSRD
jgi:PAS domain S-box-containing protein